MKPRIKPRRNCALGQHDPAPGFAIDANGVAVGHCRRCRCGLKRLPWSRQWFCADRMG
ncbi:hypothetical protein U1872_04930 [Sphingomonas sp. RB3P16]|uniref:hypothetical protein n=1 Tax=Parasphingomonas frigoris TaxID=3096163 RepID=UPI002FC94EFB